MRMEQLGAKGVLVSGRVRDLDTLKGLKIPVWSKGTSSVGAGAQTKAYAVGYPITIGDVTVISVSGAISVSRCRPALSLLECSYSFPRKATTRSGPESSIQLAFADTTDTGRYRYARPG